MKASTKKYISIFYVATCLAILMYFMWPTKKNQLEFIEEEIKKVETKQKILTEKEKELEKLATEKDWAEVDKDSNKSYYDCYKLTIKTTNKTRLR